MDRIKVLVVDDSAVVRRVASEILQSDPGIEFLGAAADPIFAMQRMEKQWPDVIILDIEMPRMDGLTFLKKLMAEHPTPVVICSTLTESGAESTMEAMAGGAVDIITKPKMGLKGFLEESAHLLLQSVKAAARADLKKVGGRPAAKRRAPAPGHQTAEGTALKPAPKLNADVILPPGGSRAMAETTERVVAIGTSTGGTQALETLFTALPRVTPGIVVVQHMPEKFTAAFAARLDHLCEVAVKEAEDGDRVRPGHVLIAPGGRHMLLQRSGAHYFVEVRDGPLVSRHRPSVDVLFRSTAKSAGRNAVGIIMTGMGDDGANGLLEMRRAGAHTIAQDEASCLVYGMPKEAVARGGAVESLPLDELPEAIIRNA